MDLNQLKAKSWKTAGARFNAYRRLRNKLNASIFSISILSLYNISIAIFDIVPLQYNSGTTVVLSVFIIIVSLLEFSKDYATKAERMHVNAMKINAFNNKLHLEKELSQKLLDEYENIKSSCSENHEPQDLNIFLVQKKEDFFKEDNAIYFAIRKLCYILDNFIRTYFIYAVLLVSPLAVFLIPS